MPKISKKLKNWQWFEVHLEVTNESKDAIANYLFELGSIGCEEKKDSLIAYFDEKSNPRIVLRELQLYIQALIEQGIELDARCATVEFTKHDDWQSAWKKAFIPLEIGDGFVIKPTWEEYQETSSSIVIDIDPGMAFGTGHHETTQLSLTLLRKYVTQHCSVLDVGTGTGILTIAARKLGAGRIVAVDNDPTAVETAVVNLKVNGIGLHEDVFLFAGEVDSIANISFDVIVANISSRVLLRLANTFRTLLADDAVLLVSGILEEEESDFLQSIKNHAFSVDKRIARGEWIAFVLKLQ